MESVLAGTIVLLAGFAAPHGRDSAGGDTIRALAVTSGRPNWAAADSIDDLRQREPLQGAPASERTVVRVAHDGSALLILVRCFDSDMRRIRATQLRRDADLASDDHVELLIDSFDDHRSAFVFGTNPNGAMWDAQFTGVDDLNAS